MAKKPITVAEAGRRGGKARAKKHSPEQLREWARMGGWPKGRPRKKGGRARLPDHLVSKAALYQRTHRARLKLQAVKAARKKNGR